MTPEQRRALEEIDRLHQAAPTDLEIVGMPRERHGRVELTVGVRIGAIEIKPGGLPLGWRQLLFPLATIILAGFKPSSLVHHHAV